MPPRLFGPLAVCIAAVAMLAFPGCSGCVKPPVPPVVVPDVPEVVGPHDVLIVYETADVTPDFAIMLTELRDGQTAKLLKDSGHELTLLDDELVDEETRSQVNMLPALIIRDASTGKALYSGAFTTVEDMLAELRKAGGLQ
jgi:hypothetical protein